jgi:pyruvate,orthophosphate dikinase
MDRNDDAPLTALLDGSCPFGPEVIGGKGWGINRMRALGLAVPPAIALTVHACRDYRGNGMSLRAPVWDEVVARMHWLETQTGQSFAGSRHPLLVSVRSGAPFSMPGMMDTVLDLGINARVEAVIGAESGDPGFAADTRRRFAQQYRHVVLGGLDGNIPADPWAQLRAAVCAVFDSWDSPRAQLYRRNRRLSDDAGTAVTIQQMVYGNRDLRSGTGVVFSRNPSTGEPAPWGEWMPGGQGEDVVSGVITPQPLSALREDLPEAHAELMRAVAALERDARDIEDIEFTVESGRLWVLQSRIAKRSPQAAVRAAVAFAEEGIISREDALRRITAEQVRQLPVLLLSPRAAYHPPVAKGEPASPGIACGTVVTNPSEAETRSRNGEDVILARPLTSPEDLRGVLAARGLITEQGGATSHAAVVSRELGRPCVVGCGAGTVTSLAGQRVTLDGNTGRIFAGDLTGRHGTISADGDVHKLSEWARPFVPMEVLPVEGDSAGAIDLDRLADEWRTALAPGAVVRGRVLDSDEGIRAAFHAGVRVALVRDPFPALLSCMEAMRSLAPTQGMSGKEGLQHEPASLLRLLALKGRAGLDVLTEALAISRDEVKAAYAPLCAQQWCAGNGNGLHLTAAGREHLNALLHEERARVDATALVPLYEAFCVLDAELKQTVTAWQLRAGAPNDHEDPAYDDQVLARLMVVHQRIGPLLGRLARLLPRLLAYRDRLDRAAARIESGDRQYVARIIHDSYHTVWFELHEELLSLAGLKRSGESDAPLLQSPPGR